MEFVGEKVRILGYLVPRTRFGQVIWYLTISDDRRGIPDRYPRFVAINEVCSLCPYHFGNYQLCTSYIQESEGFTSEFTYYDDPNQSGYFGLSFQNKRMKRWYLVPDCHRRRIGISDTAEYPFSLLRPSSQYYSYCSGRTWWKNLTIHYYVVHTWWQIF